MSTCFKFSHFKGRFVQTVLESINAILESKIFKQNEKAKLSKIKEKNLITIFFQAIRILKIIIIIYGQ